MRDVHLTEVGVASLRDHGYPTYEIDLNGIELDEDVELHVRNVLHKAAELGHSYVNLYIKRIRTLEDSP